MRVLFIDIDTLRPDHLGCYGYGRNTSPCIDSIAKEGVVFENYYTPNAPCLPSRACLITGQYGIHHGCVGHGGTCGDLWLEGEPRDFKSDLASNNLFNCFKEAGIHTASISTFPERHTAYWFHNGFKETYNVGKCGGESAEEVTPVALDWLKRNCKKDDWLLHVHYWDPHTPYRAPAEFGNPFHDEPLPDEWIDDKIFAEHLQHCGPHSAREVSMWDDTPPNTPRQPGSIDTLEQMKDFMDQYDCGVRYADDNVSRLIALLKEEGVYDDLSIIITSDHGENMGELGLYAEHGTADEPTCHIPMIVKWQGGKSGFRDQGLHLNIDLAPTVQDLLHQKQSDAWDGMSYAETLLTGKDCSMEAAVLGQCAHVCQRSVRFGDYLYIRTVHSGYHLFDDEMLFNIKADPHELHNLVESMPELCQKGAKYILDWEYDMMKSSRYAEDPMWRVLREGGPYHCKGSLEAYVGRLRNTGRAPQAEELLRRYPLEKFK